MSNRPYSSSAAFYLAWHDRPNLESLVTVSRATIAAACAREDFPETGNLAAARSTAARLADGALAAASEPVAFIRIQPGRQNAAPDSVNFSASELK